MNTIPYSRFVASVVPRLCTEPKVAEAVVAAIVSSEVANNDAKTPPAVDDMTAFHALEAPSIHVCDYVHRLSSYSFSSTTCLLAALYYVKRAVAKDSRLAPTSLSVHRLLITGLVLAAKFFDDVTYSMSYYAKVGGLPVKELAYLELKFLALLDFRLHICTHEFHTLEIDLIDCLSFVPRSPAVADASTLVRSHEINGGNDVYCETLHHDDVLGLWFQHPNPNLRMLTCPEMSGSPCDTPPRSLSPASHSDLYTSQHKQRTESEYKDGSGKLHRFCSNSSSVTDDGSYSEPRQYVSDEGSGPLARHSSSTSTVTSETSVCTTDTDMYSERASNENSPKCGVMIGNGQPRAQAQVYCRFGGSLTQERWETGPSQFDAEVRAALRG